ncbi:MAG: SDR family oxidoreductase [Rhodospirillaceae bacterium]|jgi:3-oxoacyl-[acyl-carrier protein] reductase|nr:SDR family oxidoreductase [Rhodospirillaceae bacterium]
MLKGKIAIVTGGGQGIGKHAAKTLAENGVKIAIADINQETAEKAAAELSAFSETTAVALDVRNEDDVRRTFDTIAEKFGGIDILVNNAGIVPHFRWGSPLWPHISDMPLEFWDRVIRTNLYGTFFCTKHAIPHLKNRNGGHMINLYGGGGTKPPGALTYMVTKDGIRTFTRFVAEEVRESNICVVSFSPRVPIATETAPETAKETMPGPEILGNAFVLAAQLTLESSGQCLAYEDGKLVIEGPMEG